MLVVGDGDCVGSDLVAECGVDQDDLEIGALSLDFLDSILEEVSGAGDQPVALVIQVINGCRVVTCRICRRLCRNQ